MPFRELIKERRLNFLYYILNQEADSLLFRVFDKQSENRSTKEWVSIVLTDLESMKINLTFADIQSMNKTN